MSIKGITKEPRYLPWYPEWTKRAECAKYDLALTDALFFDYGRNARRINRAKAICNVCPVIHQCFRQNLKVPLGIFAGMTALERWRFRGLKGYPNTNKPTFYEYGYNNIINDAK